MRMDARPPGGAARQPSQPAKVRRRVNSAGTQPGRPWRPRPIVPPKHRRGLSTCPLLFPHLTETTAAIMYDSHSCACVFVDSIKMCCVVPTLPRPDSRWTAPILCRFHSSSSRPTGKGAVYNCMPLSAAWRLVHAITPPIRALSSKAKQARSTPSLVMSHLQAPPRAPPCSAVQCFTAFALPLTGWPLRAAFLTPGLPSFLYVRA